MKDRKLRSALHYACQNDNYTLVRKLLEAFSIEDVNCVDSSGRTPLAILFSKTSHPTERTVRVLIEKGADLNVLSEFPNLDHFRRGFHPDPSGKTHRSSPLIVCVVHTNLKYVKLLLELGAEVNLVDESGDSSRIQDISPDVRLC
jgi:ankyrin repeat protein